MDLSNLAEPFPASDVEWRIQSSGVTKDGKPWCRVLCYIQARAVMARLDEVVGPANWRVSYRHEQSGVMCCLAIRVTREEDAEWIEKWDGAQETDIESFKGGLSSALKRAGVCWQIGRYLYGLEDAFAECSANPREFPHYGKTKDGTTFSWKPPALPAWALPSSAATAHATQAEAQEAAQNPPGRATKVPGALVVTDAQLRKIGALRRDLGLSEEEYHRGLEHHYGQTSTKNLTKTEAKSLIERLEARLTAKLADEKQEAFGGEGRLGQLRSQALGFCATMNRHGSRYLDGRPIDYEASFGLAGGTLVELEEMIRCIADEAELEGVILKLEKVLEDMAF